MKTLRLAIATLFGLAMVSGCSGLSSGPRATPHMTTPSSLSPASIHAAPMAHTAILPASVMNVRPQSAVQGLSFTQIPGAASSAAAAPDGSLWVLSTSPAGADKYIWHYANGSWTNISGLASRLSVAPNGTLYAVNSGGGTYSYSAGTWTALGGGASDVTAAADGSFYVLSNGNSAGSDQAIWHYTSGWSQVAGAGVKIAASWDTGSYAQPNGTISANGLYVLNSGGNIYHENTDNSFVQLPGNASAVASTTIGGIFVLGYPSNSGGNSIYYYNLNTPGWSAQAGSGVSISTNSADLYVIGSTGGIYYSPVKATSGTVVEYPLSTSGYPLGIAPGTDGNLWFTEYIGNKIGKITPSGSITEYVVPTPGASLAGIAAGPDGSLWFAERFGGKIGRITTSGAITEYVIPTTGSATPYFIAAGPDGNLWFTEFDHDNNIGKITTGGTITEYALPTASAGAEGIAAGPDGNLWFTESSINKIGKITTSGTITEYVVPTTGSSPSAIAAGPDGNLWFTELSKIGKITPSGAFTEYTIPTGSPQPLGIAAGPDGNLWFTESVGNKIGKITPSGSITEYLLPTSQSYPFGIAVGRDGNLWFPESQTNRIGKITP
jgi:streptogramin lyase